jgi:hypothetical protein
MCGVWMKPVQPETPFCAGTNLIAINKQGVTGQE